MSRVVLVLPYIYKPYYEECRATLSPQAGFHDIVAIDNTGIEGAANFNRGVAESWNAGIDALRKWDADWLVICSATMRFGEAGGMDMLEQIKEHPYAHIIHFAKKDIEAQNYAGPASPAYDTGVFYWHLTAVRKDVFDRVGYFDPNFYPIYFEDTDFDIRFNKAYQEPQRLILPIDAESAGLRHGVEKSGLKVSSEPGIAYFATKWGRHPSAAQLGEYDAPFDDPANSIKFFPPARGRLWNE